MLHLFTFIRSISQSSSTSIMMSCSRYFRNQHHRVRCEPKKVTLLAIIMNVFSFKPLTLSHFFNALAYFLESLHTTWHQNFSWTLFNWPTVLYYYISWSFSPLYSMYIHIFFFFLSIFIRIFKVYSSIHKKAYSYGGED